jgi:hypothetical protein
MRTSLAAFTAVFLFYGGAAAEAQDHNPSDYDRRGVVNCALPGTAIEFYVDGKGNAHVAHVESNFPPFLEAATKRPIWRALVSENGNTRILILDSGYEATRIMVEIGTGQGMAFTGGGGGGASDILCQVLVEDRPWSAGF